MKLPSLRTMTQAGGKITLELHEKFAAYAEEQGKQFVVMYGAAEATSRMGYLPPERAVEKKGSMGIPIPGGTFRLVDTDDREITEPFVTGELVYEGKNVTLGYADCGEDLILGDERHGILETGDMAQFDEDGDAEYADTVRDFVISKTKLNPAAFKVIVIDEIPKNESGKTLYKELKKYYAE